MFLLTSCSVTEDIVRLSAASVSIQMLRHGRREARRTARQRFVLETSPRRSIACKHYSRYCTACLSGLQAVSGA